MTVTRESLIHCARVYVRESRARTRQQRAFSFILLGWAARCRREAVARPRLGQRDLFGGVA